MTIKVRGLDEVEEVLDQLPDRVSRNVLTASLRLGARVIAKAAAENLRASPSVDSGLLSVSITSRARRKSKGGRAVVSVGAARKAVQVRRKGRAESVKAVPSRYAHLVEFGTKNMPAEPFMRPALDEKAVEAIRVIGEAMAKRIDAEAAKLAAGKISFATGKKIG